MNANANVRFALSHGTVDDYYWIRPSQRRAEASSSPRCPGQASGTLAHKIWADEQRIEGPDFTIEEQLRRCNDLAVVVVGIEGNRFASPTIISLCIYPLERMLSQRLSRAQ